MRNRMVLAAALAVALPLCAQELKVEEHVLSNGMTLVLVPRPDEPSVSAGWVAHVEKVTRADVKRVAQRLLRPESATLLVVGREAEVLNPDPKHPVKLADLTGGKLTELPLRDPLTMQPISRGEKR
jgi:predicted Zn-dependent peptidase